MQSLTKKLLALLLCLGFLFLTACGGGSDTPAEGSAAPAETSAGEAESTGAAGGGDGITVLCPAFIEGAAKDAFMAYIQENMSVPVTFEEAPINYSDTVNKVTTMMASGDDTVDVFHIDEIMQLAFLSADFLEPIDDVITEEDLGHFLPGYAETFLQKDGVTYGIPTDVAGILFFVNQKMFEEAGVEIPTNEEEFIAAAQALTGDGKNGLLESWDKASHLQDNLNRWCLMFGGNFYDWNLEGSQKAIKFMYDLVNTYQVVSIDNLSDNYETANQKMCDGQAAMYFQWSGATKAFGAAGKYGSPDSEIITAPMPTFVTNQTPMSSWMWVVNKNSANMDAAKEYMKLMVGEEAQSLFEQSTWLSPTANVDAWEDSALMEGLNAVPEHKEYLDAGSLTARTLCSKHSEYMDTVTGTLQRYLLDEITFEECIEQGQAEIDSILASLE